jgi:hypothetical protein
MSSKIQGKDLVCRLRAKDRNPTVSLGYLPFPVRSEARVGVTKLRPRNWRSLREKFEEERKRK